MSVSYEQQLYHLLCDYYEGQVSSGELHTGLYNLKANMASSSPRRASIELVANSILLNDLTFEKLEQKIINTEPAERRRVLLYRLGLNSNLFSNKLDINIFRPQGVKDTTEEFEDKARTFLSDLKGNPNAMLAAAILDTAFSPLQKGGGGPAPVEEAPWYYYVPEVPDTQETYRGKGPSISYFQHGRTIMKGKSNSYEIGVSTLWLDNGFRQVTFTVHESIREMERWEDMLIRFGAVRQLAGPSVFIASRLLLHTGNHRVYTMIWPAGDQNPWNLRNGFFLQPYIRVLLYCRIITPLSAEVSFYTGQPGDPPQTIKYPHTRKSEVVRALQVIGMQAARKQTKSHVINKR